MDNAATPKILLESVPDSTLLNGFQEPAEKIFQLDVEKVQTSRAGWCDTGIQGAIRYRRDEEGVG
jgi:hypothetical protein